MLDLILFILLMLLVVLLFILVEVGDITNKFKRDEKFAGGKGTRSKPFLINSQGQLNRVRDNLDKHFRQINDINLENYCELRGFSGGWQPIGSEENKFTGSFDGQDYVIKNLSIEGDEHECLGLFACTGSGAILQDINLQNVNIKGKRRIAGLVGKNEGLIKNCRVSGQIKGEGKAGAIVGENAGRVENCEQDVSICMSNDDKS